jgi:hypothetical protein
MGSFDPTLVVVLDEHGEQLLVERPTGHPYCLFYLLSADGRVRCHLSGYAASVAIYAGYAGAAPFLQVGNATISLPIDSASIRQLGDYIGAPYPYEDETEAT